MVQKLPNPPLTDTVTYWTYNSEELALYPTQEVEVEVFPAGNRWEYVRMDNCPSDNPEECIVLCYRSYPAETIMVTVATDTSLGSPIKVQELVTQTHSEASPPIWASVNCKLTRHNRLPIDFSEGHYELDASQHEIIDNRLLSLMRKYPQVVFEISHHTDCQGGAEQNFQLSRDRAQAVADYLIEKGISRERLVVKGLGEQYPIKPCQEGVDCTDKDHRRNRRTEFRVIDPPITW